MIALDERLVRFDSGGAELHGVLHLPAGDARGTLVFVHPFAEEKKCSHRTMVEAARGCAQAGWSVLRFDLRGCGDSPGGFGEFDLDDWLADVEAAVDFAERETGSTAGLLGLRLGATLAAAVAERRPGVRCLVLWEPIVTGERYITQNLRRSMIKAMMTRHEAGERTDGAAQEAHALGEGTVDFDGYRVPEAMRDAISAIDLLTGPRGFAGPVLVVNLAPREDVSQPLQELADAYPHGAAIAVRQEPVWQRIGIMDAARTITATLDWLQQINE